MSEQKVGNFTREDFERHVRPCLPAACLYVFDALLDTAFSAEARVQRLEEALREARSLRPCNGKNHPGGEDWDYHVCSRRVSQDVLLASIARAALAAPDKEQA